MRNTHGREAEGTYQRQIDRHMSIGICAHIFFLQRQASHNIIF
jgi:hypothetical protein